MTCSLPEPRPEVRMDLRPAPDRGAATNDDAKIGRASFLRRAVIVGSAVVTGELVFSGLPQISSSAPSETQDDRIFAFIRTLEQLQVAFYEQALAAKVLSGEQLQFAQVIGSQEKLHLDYLERRLGPGSSAPPRFQFGEAAMTAHGFLAATVGVEELGLGAYNGQAPNLTPAGLRSAGKIISVEARHVAWARSLAGELPAPDASDAPLTQDEVAASVKGSGYVR